jgi:DNA-binding MarR family transcriptional regulator
MSSNRKSLEKELDKLSINKEYNFGRVLSHLKKHFDEWSLANLSRAGYPNMKMGYMAFLMNIGSEGITNNDLAKKIRVTKQAMSKTSKELQQLNLIELSPNPADARSSLITLTTYGLKMVINCRQKMNELTGKYIEVVGQKKYRETLDNMNKFISIHISMEDDHKDF